MISIPPTPGAPNLIDLASPAPEASAEFCRAAFGWEVQSAGPGGFGFLRKEGRLAAVVGPIIAEGFLPTWTVFFLAIDADAAAKRAEQFGGAKLGGPFDVMDAGRMAYLADPGGVRFAVWQPGTILGFEAASELHTLSWLKLRSSAPSTVLPFYRSLFGWKTRETADGTLLSGARGEERKRPFGGLTAECDGEAPGWTAYFRVDDVDATVRVVEALGGRVRRPAADTPWTGRSAVVTDQFGAHFAVHTPAR